jgi:hypothetical protein
MPDEAAHYIDHCVREQCPANIVIVVSAELAFVLDENYYLIRVLKPAN